MKKLFFIIFIILFCTNLSAQKHEIGISLGGANTISDIGRTEYINPFPNRVGGAYVLPISAGIIYRLNYNPQHTIRVNLSYFQIGQSELTVPEKYRKDRGLEFKNAIYEASTVFEYNFYPINSEQQRAYSPYIFAGLAGFYADTPLANVYHQFQRDEFGNIMNPNTHEFESAIEYDTKKQIGFSIPFGAGIKYKFGWNWVVSVEVGFRPTFKDDLDLGTPKESNYNFFIEENLLDSYTEEAIIERNKEIINNTNIGNPSTNDWYVFSGLTLTYTFGRPPCFCD